MSVKKTLFPSMFTIYEHFNDILSLVWNVFWLYRVL